jgi:hypothetical protein
MKCFYKPVFTLLVIVAGLHISAYDASAFSSSDTDIQHRLIGSWKAVSFTDVPDRGETIYPFGTAPNGLMIYAADGCFSIFVMAGPNSSGSKDMSTMSAQEWQALFHDFLSWFGTYRVDNSQTLALHVNGSSVPAYNGTEQTRTFKLERDTLVFYGDYTKSGIHYHYEHVFRRVQ